MYKICMWGRQLLFIIHNLLYSKTMLYMFGESMVLRVGVSCFNLKVIMTVEPAGLDAGVDEKH